jgi:hypothetical protein
LHSCNAKPESEHYIYLRHHQLLIRIELPLITRVQSADLQITGVGKTPLDFTILQRRRTTC